MDKYKFGEFIYNLRIANHLTQDELGRKIGVTNKAVSKWEVGETLPDVSLMPLLAKALGVTTDELYAGEVMKIDPIKIVKKKKPIIWIILISILSLLLIGTSSYILFENIKKDNEVCYLNEDNYQNYLVITPIYRSTNENDKLYIYGKIELLNKECFNGEISVNFTSFVEYYYINTNNQNALISYMNLKNEVIIDSSNETYYSLKIEPIKEITDFKEYKGFAYDYRVDKINGTIKNI